MPRASSLLPLALFISAFTSGCGEENSVGGNEGGTTSAGGATGSGGRASIGGAPNEGGAAGAPSKDRELVTLEFRARVGDQPFACGERYPGVGATDTEVTPRDLRFFVSNVRLIDAGGDEVPVELEVRSPWQGAGVALLDFEDGTASCVNGNSLLNSTVTGYAPPGAYAGLAFSTSVPVELNHADPTAQPSPLEVGTLHWSWLAGYIFFRAELASTAPPVDGETPGLGVFHLGSVGCTMDGSSTECSRPNRNDVVLQAFDAARDVVTLDLAQVFASADLSRSAMCHSHGEACGPYFAQLGVDAESGAPSEQGAFHVEGEVKRRARLAFASCVLSGALSGACGEKSAIPPHDHGSHSHGGEGGGGTAPPIPIGGASAYDWDLPPGFPAPWEPSENPTTREKVELGRHLFYDARLSVNGESSCATCHVQELAFTDGRALSVGTTGQAHPRSSMSLANVGYASTLTWANPLLHQLERQALVPLFGADPIELGLRDAADIEARVAGDETYAELFESAFPDAEELGTLQQITRALASFQRTLISGRSPYDRWIQGDKGALDESAKRGFQLFNSEKLECFHCHTGFNFTTHVHYAGKNLFETPFHNTGLYNVDGEGAYPEPNTGVSSITLDPKDMGRFKPPTLRNVAVTAPYMHDGSVATLSEVLDHYAAGGRTLTRAPYAGDGSKSPLKDPFVVGFTLTEQERADVIAFLESLTDEEFLTNPAFGNPWTQ